MAKQKKLRKITQSEKKEFIFRNKTYKWEENYTKIIDLRLDDIVWSYDKDNRYNCINGAKISDLQYDMLIEELSSCMHASGLSDMIDKNMIMKAITTKCKINQFSLKQEHKEKAKAEKEKAKLEAKAEKEKAKAEKEKAKLEAKADLPNKIYTFLKDNYKSLEYNETKKTVYLNGDKLEKEDKDKILWDVQTYFEEIGVFAPMKIINSVLVDLAKEKRFKETIVTSKDEDVDFDMIKDIDEVNWESKLVVDDKENLKHNIFNYMLFLSFHPQFKDKIKMNAFDKIEYLVRFDKSYDDITNKPIDDYEADLIKSYIEKYFGSCNNHIFQSALNNVLLRNSFHPIKQYFNELKENYDAKDPNSCNEYGWDGVERVHKMFVKYFDCPDIAPIHEMTEVMMCGAYQRIYEERPDAGVPFDFMGIIFGKQGTGKTKFFTRLFGDKYSIINPSVNDDQSFVDLTNRAWLVLFDEMKGIDKADMPTVKSRITEQGCTVRLSYGRRSRYYPRHCVYWGNTNETYVLRDDGYERRFLCFESNAVKRPASWWEENYTDYIINQIWAETATIYYNKYVGKIIEISEETQVYNQMIQIKHKIWNDDTRTKVELDSIFKQKYEKMVYFESDFKQFLREIDINHLKNDGFLQKNDTFLCGFELKIVKKEWILFKFNRKNSWIDGIVKASGWSEIEIDDDFLGKGTYYIKDGIKYEDIKNEYEESYDLPKSNTTVSQSNYYEDIFFNVGAK